MEERVLSVWEELSLTTTKDGVKRVKMAPGFQAVKEEAQRGGN